MPKAKICDQCPNKEYKNVKKKTNRKKRDTKPQDVCSDKGDGVWMDDEDCTVYYLCRHLGTSWAEEKKELCYSGSYFDQTTKSCKWVGVGSVDCSELVQQEEKPVKKPKERNSKTTAKSTRTEKSRQKTTSDPFKSQIVGELSSKTLPRAMHTCKADKEQRRNDTEHDHIKCYACESGSIDMDKCKQANRTGSIVKCLKNQQTCFTKIVRDATTGQIELLSRGCISLDNLDFLNNTKKHENNNQADKNRTTMHCISRSKKLRSCYALCDRNLCNDLTSIVESFAIRGRSFSEHLVVFCLVFFWKFNNF
jgi:hypothetical protein